MGQVVSIEAASEGMDGKDGKEDVDVIQPHSITLSFSTPKTYLSFNPIVSQRIANPHLLSFTQARPGKYHQVQDNL